MKINIETLSENEVKDALRIFDNRFKSLKDLISAVKNRKILVHARRSSFSKIDDFKYGVEPELGETLSGTEAIETTKEYGIKPVPLVFASEGFDWIGDSRNTVVFLEKTGFQKSLGNGKVELENGTTVSYEKSPIADFEKDALKDEPAGVERGDCYTTKIADAVAVLFLDKIDRSDSEKKKAQANRVARAFSLCS